MTDNYEVRFDPPIDKVLTELKEFGAGLETKALRSALVYSVRDLKKRIKSIVRAGRYSTGVLARAIGHRSLNRTALAEYAGADAGLYVGATRKQIDVSGRRRKQKYKLQFLEGGTDEHVLPWKGRPRPMHVKTGQAVGVYSRITHPGITAQKPLERSLAATRGGMQRNFYQGLEHWINKRQVIINIADDAD